jgi:Flp pilus assembly pilin Flp
MGNTTATGKPQPESDFLYFMKKPSVHWTVVVLSALFLTALTAVTIGDESNAVRILYGVICLVFSVVLIIVIAFLVDRLYVREDLFEKTGLAFGVALFFMMIIAVTSLTLGMHAVDPAPDHDGHYNGMDSSPSYRNLAIVTHYAVFLLYGRSLAANPWILLLEAVIGMTYWLFGFFVITKVITTLFDEIRKRGAAAQPGQKSTPVNGLSSFALPLDGSSVRQRNPNNSMV